MQIILLTGINKFLTLVTRFDTVHLNICVQLKLINTKVFRFFGLTTDMHIIVFHFSNCEGEIACISMPNFLMNCYCMQTVLCEKETLLSRKAYTHR
jgi:hypothetical protein